jgi:hypothetical protein
VQLKSSVSSQYVPGNSHPLSNPETNVVFPQRCLASEEYPDVSVPVYSIHTVFVLVAPSVFAASIYMCLGRLILITDGEKHSLIRARWLTKIFVVGDVISFLMQGAGGGRDALG